MTKIAKRPKKEVKQEVVVEKATVVAKNTTSKAKVDVKELQLELQVKEQQLELALSTVESLEKIIETYQKEKQQLMSWKLQLESRITALLNRGIFSRILNIEV